MSDRIIDCPVRVIMIADPLGFWAPPITHTTNRAAQRVATLQNRTPLEIVFIWIALGLRCSVEFYRNFSHSVRRVLKSVGLQLRFLFENRPNRRHGGQEKGQLVGVRKYSLV